MENKGERKSNDQQGKSLVEFMCIGDINFIGPAIQSFSASFLFFCRFSGVLRMLHIMDGGEITGEGQMHAPPFFADADDSDWMVEGPISSLTWIIGIVFGAGCLYYYHSNRGKWACWNYYFHDKDPLYSR